MFLFALIFGIKCDDDEEEFGWGLGLDDDDFDDTPKEVNWDKVNVTDALILGSGPAGCTAALYLARAGFKPIVLHGNIAGGQLVYTSEIENFPGFKGTGPELVKSMEKQAKAVGAKFELEKIVTVDLSQRPFRLTSEFNKGYKAKVLIIATGANARFLGIPSEMKLRNRGVSACAVCDGPLYKGKDVAVVGGGDAAVEEALYLSRIAKSVKLIHRRDQLRASLPMKKRIEESSVEIIWNSVVEEVLGENSVTGLRIKNVKTNEKTDLKLEAVFMAIGHDPATEPFKGQLEMDQHGYIITQGGPKTSVKGVYAAGDCADKVYRQAITSAGTGAQAAILAERYLHDEEL